MIIVGDIFASSTPRLSALLRRWSQSSPASHRVIAIDGKHRGGHTRRKAQEPYPHGLPPSRPPRCARPGQGSRQIQRDHRHPKLLRCCRSRAPIVTLDAMGLPAQRRPQDHRQEGHYILVSKATRDPHRRMSSCSSASRKPRGSRIHDQLGRDGRPAIIAASRPARRSSSTMSTGCRNAINAGAEGCRDRRKHREINGKIEKESAPLSHLPGPIGHSFWASHPQSLP